MTNFGIFCCLTIVTVIHGIYFKEENITSGVTFIKETSGSLSYQKWNIIYYYGITSYLDQIVLFENAIEEIHRACELLDDKNEICTTLTVRLEKYHDKIEHSRDIIKKFHTEGRYKRSLSTPVSAIILTLLGLADENWAIKFDGVIDQLNHNTQTHNDLRKAQISVFKESLVSTDNMFKELTKKLKSLNSYVKKIKHTVSNQTSHTGHMENLNYLLQTATLIMIDHSRVSDTIIHLLTGSSPFRFTELLPASKLQENLREINYALDTDKQLPINIDTENIYEIFKISQIKTTIINNRLLIIATIPIINTVKYDLFRAIPIPTRVNDEAVTMHLSSEYFLINKPESHLIPITREEYTNYARKSNDQVICTPSSPIYVGKHTGCETILFSEADQGGLNIYCKYNIRKIPLRNYFIKLGSSNLFYVFIDKPIVVRFLCDGREPSDISIAKSGVLALDDKCVVLSEGIIIEAIYETGFESKYLMESPRFNVSEFMSLKHTVASQLSESKGQEELEEDLRPLENFENEFNELQKRVEQIGDFERKIAFDEQMNDISSFNEFSWLQMTYISVVIVILFAVIVKTVNLFRRFIRNHL